MSVLNRIAYFQNRRDEVPNQELARELAGNKDHKGIAEIAENLWNKEQNVRSDCLKVLYETGYLAPELIAEYADDFLKLLHDKNNRMIWGGMIALSTIAEIRAEELFNHLQELHNAIEKGSVITVDGGVLTLARIASTREEFRHAIFPYLLNHLKTCRPKDVSQHAEKSLMAVDGSNKNDFILTLETRLDHLSETQKKRVKKVIKEAENR